MAVSLLMRRPGSPLLIAVVALAVAACGGSGGTETIDLHVAGTPSRRSGGQCVFVIQAPLVGGGRQHTCLTKIDGFPGPRARMRSKGRMSFVLPGGSIEARVDVTQRFAADGMHARQTLSGSVIRGTGRFRGRRGTIRGGGTVVDRRSALGRVDLHYTLSLKRDSR